MVRSRASQLSQRLFCDFFLFVFFAVSVKWAKSGGGIKIEICHENGRHESSESLDHTVLHRISVRIQPRRRHFTKPLVLKSCFFNRFQSKMTLQNNGCGEMSSSRLDSHRNSVQNGMVERFTAFTATIFVPNFSFYVAATFCPLDGNCKNDQKTKKLREEGQDAAFIIRRHVVFTKLPKRCPKVAE